MLLLRAAEGAAMSSQDDGYDTDDSIPSLASSVDSDEFV